MVRILFNCILQNADYPLQYPVVRILLLSAVCIFFVGNEHLFLVGRFYDVAFWSDSNIVILPEIFFDQAYWSHFVYDSSDVYGFALYLFNDIMVISLKIFVVFLWDAVLNEIGAMLDCQLFFMLWCCLSIAIEDIGQFCLLIITLEYSSAVLLVQKTGLLFIESSLVVVDDIETLDHFWLVELIA